MAIAIAQHDFGGLSDWVSLKSTTLTPLSYLGRYALFYLLVLAITKFLQEVLDHVSTDYEELEQQNRALEACNEALAAERRWYKLLFELAPDGYLVTDTLGTILFANRAIAAQLHMPREHLVGKPLPLFLTPACREKIYVKLHQINSATAELQSYEWDLVFCPRGHDPFDAAITLSTSPLLPSRSDCHLLWLIRDVTQQRRLERQIKHLAFHDALTGLPNRRWFNQHLGDRLSRLTEVRTAAVAIIDVDRFKPINDTYGHGVGDALLKAFAARLSQGLTANDALCRWAGDEFALVIHCSSATRLAQRSEQILEQLRAPFQIQHSTIHATGSLGVARCQPGDAVDTVLMRADLALYQAKRQGRNTYYVYRHGTARDDAGDTPLERDLRHLLNSPATIEQQLTLRFQPQVDCLNRKIIALEALVRWQHPRQGLLYPNTFIDLAETSDLIWALGEWTLKEGLRQAQQWRSQRCSQRDSRAMPVLAINLSPRQFQQPNLTAVVVQCLTAANFKPCELELEITETRDIDQSATSRANLLGLAQAGVNIALDDFGTGYSSFARLKQLPIDTLKVDRSLIANLGHQPADDAIVGAIVALAQGLKVNLVAEGVETTAQKQTLQALGCHKMQGYLFSRAVPADQVPSLLASFEGVI